MFNKVLLIGRLGKDPQVLKSTEKSCFVRLNLATQKKITDATGNVSTETQWHFVYLSNGLGKSIASYAKKGAKVFIEGELRTNEWKDKGKQTKFTTAVYATKCDVLVQKQQQDDRSVGESAVKTMNEILSGTSQK